MSLVLCIHPEKPQKSPIRHKVRSFCICILSLRSNHQCVFVRKSCQIAPSLYIFWGWRWIGAPGGSLIHRPESSLTHWDLSFYWKSMVGIPRTQGLLNSPWRTRGISFAITLRVVAKGIPRIRQGELSKPRVLGILTIGFRYKLYSE